MKHNQRLGRHGLTICLPSLATARGPGRQGRKRVAFSAPKPVGRISPGRLPARPLARLPFRRHTHTRAAPVAEDGVDGLLLVVRAGLRGRHFGALGLAVRVLVTDGQVGPAGRAPVEAEGVVEGGPLRGAPGGRRVGLAVDARHGLRVDPERMHDMHQECEPIGRNRR
eukprot:scaffold647930_cov31-Prasinocladus_malaysianus.AAC.2